MYSLNHALQTLRELKTSRELSNQLSEPCLAVDLLDLKVFPQTKGCTTGVGFVLTFYRITFVHQNLLS